jgi:nitroreductase
MKTEELAGLIKGRRSIRCWLEKPVDEEALLQAIELATWAPNGGNQQNWLFYVILKKSVIASIADAVQSRADYVASLPEASQIGENLARMLKRSDFFRNAPSVIAVASSQYKSPLDQISAAREKTDPKIREMIGWRSVANTRIQSVAAAIAYLLLILHQKGLGAVWMTGPMQAKGDIEKTLNVPEGMDLVALIPVGYPAEDPAPRERRPVRDVTRIIS